uniref:Uncharacterized protein n=1 Tax=Arundo donax TaxID=35708 RepID=A0A0A9BJ71_ARUDO
MGSFKGIEQGRLVMLCIQK